MSTFSSVCYIDPLLHQPLSFDGKSFGVTKDRTIKIASRVAYSDITIHSFRVSASTSESELRTMVEIKMYEEAGLDLQKQYKIAYIRKELENNDNVLVEAYAIEETKTRTTLAQVLKTEKYIDILTLPFLAFGALYEHKILAPKNDLFVYIAQNEAFLAIYKNGNYVATKSILCLEDMLKRLKRDEITFSIETLQTLLVSKGLDTDNYTPEEISTATAIQNLFVEIFTKINDILVHNRNIFGMPSIDRIYMSTSGGRVKGLRDFLESFGFEKAAIHDMRLIKECQSDDPFACIATLYAYYHGDQDALNMTLFVRPPSFFKTHVGRLALYGVAASLVAGLYPAYLTMLNADMDAQIALLEVQQAEVKKSTANFNTTLTKLKNELKGANELNAEQQKALDNIHKSIDELYAMKAGKQRYVDFITQVNGLLKEYALMVRSIEQKGASQMVIEVVAEEEQRDTIAKFMEALLKAGFVGVNTQEILADKGLYISKIAIER